MTIHLAKQGIIGAESCEAKTLIDYTLTNIPALKQ